jgi:hypothetical protein
MKQSECHHTKIGRWITDLEHAELDAFKTLNDFTVATGEDISIHVNSCNNGTF